MVSNRQSGLVEKGRCKIPIQVSKWDHGGLRSFTNVINALKDNTRFETFLRNVVREEVEPKIQDHLFPRARVNEAGISGVKPLKLCFTNKLPDTIFTFSNLISEDESPLQIALIDVTSQSIVTSGPFSSLKIEICVLKDEDWNEDEFNSNILIQRDRKQPLLIGERFITLKNGIGYLNNTFITDNSRWQRSRKFRLGVRVVGECSSGGNVKEGRSEAFVVKDGRGESYKKHYPPSLNDDIWRLKKIAKGGKFHKRLSPHGIHTVKDLLQLYITNESSLHEKFGKIPRKSWLAIIKHAKTCVIDDYKLYSYHIEEHSIGMLFNSIYMLVGVTFDKQNYHSLDSLSPSEKHLVEVLKKQAYKNVNNLKSVDEASLNYLNLASYLKARKINTSDLQHINISTVQDQQEIEPCNEEIIHANQIHADPQNSPVEDEFSSGMYTEGYFNGSNFPVLQDDYSMENESPEIQFINSSPSLWEAENNFFFGYSAEEFSSHSSFLNSAVDITSSVKPKAVWYKIRAALRWVLSVRRDAAARKNANLFYYNR